MKDMHKNILVMVIVTILITVICHFLELDTLTLFIEMIFVIFWLMFSPFKFTDDV